MSAPAAPRRGRRRLRTRQPRRDQRHVVAAARELRRLAVDVLGDPAELRVVVVADDRDAHAGATYAPAPDALHADSRNVPYASGTLTAKATAAVLARPSRRRPRCARAAGRAQARGRRPGSLGPAAPRGAGLEDRVPLLLLDARAVVARPRPPRWRRCGPSSTLDDASARSGTALSSTGWTIRSSRSELDRDRERRRPAAERARRRARRPASRAASTASSTASRASLVVRRGAPPAAPPPSARRSCGSSASALRPIASMPPGSLRRRARPVERQLGLGVDPRERRAQLVRELGGEPLLVPQARGEAVEERVERRAQPGQLVVRLAELEAPVEVAARSTSAAFSVIRETGRRALPRIQRAMTRRSARRPSARTSDGDEPGALRLVVGVERRPRRRSCRSGGRRA